MIRIDFLCGYAGFKHLQGVQMQSHVVHYLTFQILIRATLNRVLLLLDYVCIIAIILNIPVLQPGKIFLIIVAMLAHLSNK